MKTFDLHKRLIVGIIGVLSTIGTFMPAMAYTKIESGNIIGAEQNNIKQASTIVSNYRDESYSEYINNNTEKSKDGSKVTVSTEVVEATLVEGWNVLNGDSTKICYIKNGVKLTGWQMIEGWRYFDSYGNMLINKWRQDGAWYYLGCKGNRYANTYVASLGGQFNASGVWTEASQPIGVDVDNEYTTVEKSRTDPSNVSISANDFNKKVASGEIKAYVNYGSKGVLKNTLSWYLI